MYGLIIKNIWFDWLIVTWWQAWWIEYVSWVCGYIPERRTSFGKAADCFGVSVGASWAPTWVLMFSLYAFARLTVLGWEPYGLCVYLRELVTYLGYTLSLTVYAQFTVGPLRDATAGSRRVSDPCPVFDRPHADRLWYLLDRLHRSSRAAAGCHRRPPTTAGCLLSPTSDITEKTTTKTT
jgi:hypothetical protein